jgi:2-polyprenyl-3-methyl-5-hydroxy-6-metoxy-1,4-benzoquinol methylase
MSNSILEAMACGLPIITTDTGGSKKLIDGNGFVIKKRSNSAIKKALLRYQRSKKLILEHGGKSRWIALKFSWSNVADNYNKIYNQLVRPESIYYNNVTRNINSKIIQQWRTRQDSLISYLKSLPKRGTIKIIEFGSGRGFLVEELSTLGFNITGSDFNPLNLKLSKEINGVMLKKIDAENIKLSRNYYDIAVSVELIEHLTDVKMHIGQVRRILKPGGIYFISTPNILIEKIFNFLKRNRAGDRLHISSQSHKSLKKLLEEENFIITYLKMKDLTVGQKDKLNIFRMLYPVKILPKWLQPSIICVAKLKK